MTVPATPTGSVSALVPVPVTDPAGFIQDIVNALENPKSSTETVAVLVGEGLATAGFVVGAFDHPLGLAISSVPQATILAASTVIAGALGVYHLFVRSKKQSTAARVATEFHMAAAMAVTPGATVAHAEES